MATEPKGYFFPEVVADYLSEKGKKYEEDEVDYWYTPSAVGSRKDLKITVHKGGDGGNISLPGVGEFLCLDVGCWAGNGPKDEKNHERHREFGVVCGNVAVLCSFPGKSKEDQGKAGLKDGTSDKLSGDARKLYKSQIEPFLDYLSSGKLPSSGQSPGVKPKATPSPKLLGDVQVVKAMSTGTLPEDRTIHVFLGDLHLPIITDRNKTYIQKTPNTRKRVPRAGRLDLGEQAMARLRAAMKTVSDGEKKQNRSIWDAPSEVSLALAYAYGAPGAALNTLLSETVDHWDKKDTDGWMSRKEAEEWADYYIGKDGTKGAEIFQGAAGDLLAFLSLLERWTGPKLHLVQTGDLMDFWIGLKLGFQTSKDGYGVQVGPAGRELVTFWKSQTAATDKAADGKDITTGKDGGGRVLRELWRLQAIEGANLRVFMLYGNHDNYLRRLQGLSAAYHPVGGMVYAEHGHQSDSFNSDEDADKGWALTQTAFLWPVIRDWEDPLSAAKTKVSREAIPAVSQLVNDPGARLQRIARAADVCFTEKKAIYVLGHTHRAMLRKIYLCMFTSAEAVKYQLRRGKETGKLLNDGAAVVAEVTAKEVAQEAARQKELAEAYAQETVEEVKEGIGWLRQELRELAGATSTFAQKAKERAERKLEEAGRDLEYLRKITEGAGRRKVEEARKKLEAAQQELETLGNTVEAQAAWRIQQTQTKAAEAKRQLEVLEQESEAYARKKLAEARRFLEGGLDRIGKALKQGRKELTEAQAAAEKWATDKIKQLQKEAVEVRKKLEETLAKWRK